MNYSLLIVLLLVIIIYLLYHILKQLSYISGVRMRFRSPFSEEKITAGALKTKKEREKEKDLPN
jgi:hypothetical protein